MSGTYDIIIIGGGAAGTSAALTCLNRGKRTAVITNPIETGALFKAESITNYAGFANITGKELALRFNDQLCQSGAEIIHGRALSVTSLGESFGVAVGTDFYMCSAVILALGITRTNLYEGESEFLGRGVSYCATCDGMLYRGKTVAVIGLGREAEEDAAFLKSIGCNVLIFDKPQKYSILGNERAEILVADATEFNVDGVFIIKENIAPTQLVSGLESTKAGIAVDRRGATNINGVFAAGDCTGKPFQLAKAVGEGNVAALSACEFVDSKRNN